MPKKSKVRKTVARHAMIDEKTEDLISSSMSSINSAQKDASRVKTVIGVIVLLAILTAFLGSRGYVVAAMVNGKPIFRWDLNRALVARFGTQTLESMISERLIADTAQKSGVVLTQPEIEAKMKELVSSLGPDVKLDDLLKYQGMTKADFEQQIRLQLTVEKILGKDVVIQDKEIDDFISTNRATMVATDEAALRSEARQTLSAQKISEKIQPWFADLKAKAKIVRLIK